MDEMFDARHENKNQEHDPSLPHPHRTIDEFYQQASLSDKTVSALPYWVLFIALGFANSGDSAEIMNINFVLSNDEFATNILKGYFGTKGALLAGCMFGGMLFGGLLVSVFPAKLLILCSLTAVI